MILTRSLRALMLALSLFTLAAARCTPKLPPVSGCTPLSQRCREGRPEVCSATQRWHTVGDEACSEACEVSDAGVAHCALARDAGVVE